MAKTEPIQSRFTVVGCVEFGVCPVSNLCVYQSDTQSTCPEGEIRVQQVPSLTQIS